MASPKPHVATQYVPNYIPIQFNLTEVEYDQFIKVSRKMFRNADPNNAARWFFSLAMANQPAILATQRAFEGYAYSEGFGLKDAEAMARLLGGWIARSRKAVAV